MCESVYGKEIMHEIEATDKSYRGREFFEGTPLIYMEHHQVRTDILDHHCSTNLVASKGQYAIY